MPNYFRKDTSIKKIFIWISPNNQTI